ncbi:hypothetical protein GCM10009730_59920 [Streptomyces albidochromogenes]
MFPKRFACAVSNSGNGRISSVRSMFPTPLDNTATMKYVSWNLCPDTDLQDNILVVADLPVTPVDPPNRALTSGVEKVGCAAQ